jgi:CubicO group peptidase (beta-lactamase class C family)
MAANVLGAVLEKACGKPLDEIIAEYITEPLGMKNTVFYLDDLSQLSKAYADGVSKTPHLMKKLEKVQIPGIGSVYYAPGRVTNRKAYASGGAGIVGTPREYLKFLEAIRKSGAPILSEASVKAMTHDAVPSFEINTFGDGIGLGLGFGMVRDAALANTPRNTGSFFWAGAYGGEMFVDPSQGISAMLFCNTVITEYLNFAPKMIEAIYKDL